MLTTLLIVAIGLCSASIVYQVSQHARWSTRVEAAEQDAAAARVYLNEAAIRLDGAEKGLARMTAAHQRLAKQVHAIKLRTPRRTWADDDRDTREMDGGETYLPVDFQHDLW